MTSNGRPQSSAKMSYTNSRAGKVPYEKQPKSRQPVGHREKLALAPLPYYSGPYSVGMMDVEVPAREPRTFSNIKREHRHLLELETVLFTIYYPSGFGSGDGPSPSGEKKWSRPTWLPRPRVEVARGYGNFAGFPKWAEWIVAGFLGATTAFTKLPAWRNAPLANHWPPEQNARDAHSYQVKNRPGERPPGEAEKPTFPFLIFSHGLGGTRTTYSSVCGEFASYGFVVIAIEHRDGSGPRTFINLPKDDERFSKEHIDVKKGDRERGWSQMDYVFPQGNKQDTMPGNSKGIDSELRKAQIDLRLAEIEEAYHVMTLIEEGRGEEVAKMDLRLKEKGSEGGKGGSSRGLKGVDWKSWKGRFLLEHVTMLGHSFGSATTVEVLRHVDRFKFVGQGIIYDIWGAAIQPPEDRPDHRINVPLLGIVSEAFMYWPKNFEAVMSLCKEAKEQDALVWLMTVRGSVHLSQSDFTLLYPRISSLLLKMTVNPQRAIDLNINASLEFLKKVMPTRMAAMNRGTDEHLLDITTLEGPPGGEHKPSSKWVAMRLRIPHEMTLRLMPNWARRRARKKAAKEKHLSLPRDPTGRPLVGLEDVEVGEEIWMHVAPTKEELKRHGLSTEGGTEESNGGMVDERAPEGAHGHPGWLERSYMERG